MPIEDFNAEKFRARVHGNGQHKGNGKAPREPDIPPDTKPFEFVLAAGISIEPKDFLIDGFLGRYEVSAWYGPPDSGKSIVVVHAQACVAAGVAFCGRSVAQGPCLYVAAERAAVIRRRVLAWCKEHGLPDIPLAVVDHAIDLRTGRVDTDRIIATANAVAQQCKQPVQWINFDTYNRILSGGDENSSKDAGAVLASIDRIHRETNAHTSLIHHVPVDRVDRMRGHGSLLGAVDQTNRITKDEIVRVEVDKANDLVDKPVVGFTIRSVIIHLDPETGAETTAPVLDAVEGIQATKRKPKTIAVPKAAQTALRALQQAVDEVGSKPPASNHVPENTKVVTFDQWRQYAYKSGISTSEQPRARQLAFQRTSEWLIGAGKAGAWNEQAWLVQ